MHPTWIWSTIIGGAQVTVAILAYLLGYADTLEKAIYVGGNGGLIPIICISLISKIAPHVTLTAVCGIFLAYGIPSYDGHKTLLGFMMLAIAAWLSVRETEDGPYLCHLITLIPFGIGPVFGYVFMRRN